MAADEPICLAVLFLDLNVVEIVDTPKDKRMERFWRTIPAAPRSFLHTLHRRLDSEGLRWAPRSFLACPDMRSAITTYRPEHSTNPFVLGTEGLCIESPGYYFRNGLVSLVSTFYIVKQLRSVIEVLNQNSELGHNVRIPYTFHDDRWVQTSELNPFQAHSCQNAAIIVDDQLSAFSSSLESGESDREPGFLDTQNGGYTYSGILVSVSAICGGVIFCWRIEAVLMIRDSNEESSRCVKELFLGRESPGRRLGMLPFLSTDSKSGVDNLLMVDNVELPQKQRWCLQ